MPCSASDVRALIKDPPSMFAVRPSDGAISKVYNDSTKAARDRSDKVEDNVPLLGNTEAGGKVADDVSTPVGVLTFGNPERCGNMVSEESMDEFRFSESTSGTMAPSVL